MSLSLSSGPKKVALIGNPVTFDILSNSFLESAGVNARGEIHFGDTGTAGQSIVISYNDKIITLECVASPDDSGEQFQDNSVVANKNDWVDLTAEYFKANYYLFRDFEISADSGILTLLAREKEAKYSLSIDITNFTTDPATYVSLTAGEDKSLKPFYKVGLQSLILGDADYITLNEDALPVNDSGHAIFDIRKHFAGQLESDFQWPEASDNLVIQRPEICKKYKVFYFEQYGNPIINKKLHEAADYYILNGGVSKYQLAIYNRQSSSWWDKLLYNDYFLTWQPKEKTIDIYQPEKLGYLVHTDATSLKFKVRVTYNDSTEQITITKNTLASPDKYSVYEYICTHSILQMAGWEDGIIEKYEVWLENESDERISPIRTFTIDYNYYEHARYFLFLNSMGCYDTLRTLGLGEYNQDYERVETSKMLGSDFTEKDHEYNQQRSEEVRKYKVNTGIMNADSLEWIRDLFMSDRVFQVIAGKLVPVVLTSKSIKQKKDNNDLFYVDFEYQRSYKDNRFTREFVGAKFGDDFADDYDNFANA